MRAKATSGTAGATPPPRRIDHRQAWEEQRDLARGRLRTVASMHEILRELDREIAADRAGRRFAGFVVPIIRRMTFHASGPSTTIATRGDRVMKATRSPKKGFPSCSA